jgi:hypothetical protein
VLGANTERHELGSRDTAKYRCCFFQEAANPLSGGIRLPIAKSFGNRTPSSQEQILILQGDTVIAEQICGERLNANKKVAKFTVRHLGKPSARRCPSRHLWGHCSLCCSGKW